MWAASAEPITRDEYEAGWRAVQSIRLLALEAIRNTQNDEFVYAMAADAPVAMLALGNIDAREAGFSGVGRGFTDEDEWPGFLAAVEVDIRDACNRLLAGDVSLLAAQGAASARPLNLLSRYTELRNET